MEKCKICGRTFNDPWKLIIDGEIYEHCADYCHTHHLSPEARTWLAQHRKEVRSYKKNFKKR